MGDISHSYGEDADLSAGGDFLYVSDDAEAQQKVIKRLLTPAGAYIWDLLYGAGLGQFVGDPTNVAAIENVVRQQIFMESSVAPFPEPVVTTTGNPDGTTQVSISYADATTGDSKILSFPLGT